MYALDANIFLEVLLKQEKWGICAQVLEEVKLGSITAMLSDFSIDSIVIILERYGKTGTEIRKFLLSLFGYVGLRIYHAKMIDKMRATIKMERYKLDFDDSLVLQCAINSNCAGLITLDKDFQDIKEIITLQPEEVLTRRDN